MACTSSVKKKKSSLKEKTLANYCHFVPLELKIEPSFFGMHISLNHGNVVGILMKIGACMTESLSPKIWLLLPPNIAELQLYG